MTKEQLKRVVILRAAIGICGMQVCTADDATDKEILETCNRENPSGTSSGWGAVIREAVSGDLFAVKENLPVKCADYPARLHFIVLC